MKPELNLPPKEAWKNVDGGGLLLSWVVGLNLPKRRTPVHGTELLIARRSIQIFLITLIKKYKIYKM